jgi:hypothetical protein
MHSPLLRYEPETTSSHDHAEFSRIPQAVYQIQQYSRNSNRKQANLKQKQKWEGKERKGVVTVPRDLAEAPVVAALRRGVRIQRHGAGRISPSPSVDAASIGDRR